MNNPDGKPYFHSEEQIEATKFAIDGMRWGEAICASCKNEWVAIFFPKENGILECPGCHKFDGTVLTPQKPL